MSITGLATKRAINRVKASSRPYIRIPKLPLPSLPVPAGKGEVRGGNSQRIDLRQGFTLIELIVIMVIIGIMTVLALPYFSGLFYETKLSSTVQDIVKTFSYAHYRAVNEGLNCYVSFDLDKRRYWLSEEKRSGNAYEDEEEKGKELFKVGNVRYLTSGIGISAIVTAGGMRATGGQQRIIFRPDGTSGESLLYLKDKKGNIYTILLVGTTSQVKTFDYEYKR